MDEITFTLNPPPDSRITERIALDWFQDALSYADKRGKKITKWKGSQAVLDAMQNEARSYCQGVWTVAGKPFETMPSYLWDRLESYDADGHMILGFILNR